MAHILFIGGPLNGARRNVADAVDSGWPSHVTECIWEQGRQQSHRYLMTVLPSTDHLQDDILVYAHESLADRDGNMLPSIMAHLLGSYCRRPERFDSEEDEDRLTTDDIHDYED